MLLFEVTGHLKEGERGEWDQEKTQTRFFMTQQLLHASHIIIVLMFFFSYLNLNY